MQKLSWIAINDGHSGALETQPELGFRVKVCSLNFSSLHVYSNLHGGGVFRVSIPGECIGVECDPVLGEKLQRSVSKHGL